MGLNEVGEEHKQVELVSAFQVLLVAQDLGKDDEDLL